MEAPQPTRKPDSSSSSQPDRWRCHGELDMGVVERAAAVAGLVGATLPTNSTNSQRCEPFERSRANGATPKCPRSLGMIQGGTMLSSASTSPAVAICQPQSASADSGFVLPSFPRFQSISQPIFISSACGPPPEGAHPPPRLARPNCAAARFQAQDDRRARQTVGTCRVARPSSAAPALASCTLLLPWPPSSGPEVGCQMLDEPT